MKQRTHQKLLKMCVAECLLQCGFQKTSENTIEVFTDIVCHLIKNITTQITCNDPDIVLSNLMRIYASEGEYALEELFNFLRVNKGHGENVLQAMRILPANIDWEGKSGGLRLSGIFGENVEFGPEEESCDFFDHLVYDYIDNIVKKESQIKKKCSTHNLALKDENKNFIDNINENNANDIDEGINMDQSLILQIHNNGGWMNDADYLKVLHEKEKNKKYLKTFSLDLDCDLIEELYCFVFKEVDKNSKNIKDDSI